ncbi:MAG: DUF6327 family protein [Psychroflexus sp.]|nr:DUF6327 family protein [Psychroflexus sp.]MDN6310585.1 DUF6327 family protein [Psychroflexus sp.]
MKHYTSFDEIDRDLKIKKLEANIHRHKANLNLTYLKQGLSFSNLLSELMAILGQKYVYRKAGSKLLYKLGILR